MLIKKRLRIIVIAFSISFVVMAVLSFIAIRQFTSLIDYSDQVDHTNKVIGHLYRLENTIKELDVQERSYMITKDKDHVPQLQEEVVDVWNALLSLKALMRDDPAQLHTLTMLRSTIALRLGSIKNTFAYVDTARQSSISPYYDDGKKFRSESMRYIDEMQYRENILLHIRFQNRKNYQQLATNKLKYLLMVFCIVTFLLFLAMVNELKKRLSYQNELQTKILDLQRSHTELEQIAYVASHDLQEPLRKIQIFSNRLQWLKKDNIDEESNNTMQRINSAASQMQALIEDLANLTNLTRQEGGKEPVNLNRIVKAILQDLEENIDHKNATIHLEVMPEVNGYAAQLQLLFKELLDNSLKFSRCDKAPLISIRCDKVNGDELIDINKKLLQNTFYKITISDNGIGFDNKFSNKIFQIFQRLHNNGEYEGKGIGLAICQRIMVNHEGFIIAHGHLEVGATFKLFFPI